MRALFALLIVAALLFYGCAGAYQQPAPPAGGNVQQPPAPTQTGGNGIPPAPQSNTPPVPPSPEVNNTPPPPPLEVNNTPPPPPPPVEPQVKEFTIEASQWQFNPSTISVNKGDRVKITLKTLDVPHGISIPEFGFSLDVGAGQNKTGEFTADREGSFTFSCNVYCGAGHGGMKGTLVVN